jgi:hypothetical protein
MIILLSAKFVAHKTSTGTMFLLVDLEPIFNTEFVGMCMIYLFTRFHIPISNYSLVMTVEPKAKYRKKNYVNRNYIFFKDEFSYTISDITDCRKLRRAIW